MAEPYSIYKRSNGIYYVQFPYSHDGKVFQKSTGCRTRAEANKKVLEWYSDGTLLPERINADKRNTTRAKKIFLDKRALLSNLRTMEFDESDRRKIIDILKERSIIISCVVPHSKGSIDATEFYTTFWDYDKSPYVKELLSRDKSIHRSHTTTYMSRIKIYWLPRIKGKTIGEITRDDIESLFTDKSVTKLANKTINGIISSITIPLKWAYHKGYTENNCYDGIQKLSAKSKKRIILTKEEAKAVFEIDWENDSAKLANKVAMYTGMRAGEIAGLRKGDIGNDEIIVDHAWSRYDGLKSCKNGEARFIPIPIPHEICLQLRYQAALNPYDEGDEGFIFFGLKPHAPTDYGNWNKYLRRALSEIGYSNPNEICFHSWRHYFCSRMMDIVRDKRVVMAVSGHKSEQMLDHYAEHLEQEKTLEAVRLAMKEAFNEDDEKELTSKHAVSFRKEQKDVDVF